MILQGVIRIRKERSFFNGISDILGIIMIVLFKPRSWCIYCPMGTMTQMICKMKANDEGAESLQIKEK